MSTKSKIPVGANSPNRSPDKPKSSSPPRSMLPRGSKRTFDSITSPGKKPEDGRIGQPQLPQTGDQPLMRNGTRSKLPSPSSSGSLLRRSSQRIPERKKTDWVVPFPMTRDRSRPSQVASLSNPDRVDIVSPPVAPESEPVGNITGTKQVGMPEIDVGRPCHVVLEKAPEDEAPDQPLDHFDEPHARFPRFVTQTTPDTPNNFSSQKQSFSNHARPVVPRSGFRASMDTISEHSAEYEPSNKDKPRSSSLSRPRSYRLPKRMVERKASSKSALDDKPIRPPEKGARAEPPPPSYLPPPPPPSPPMPSPAPAAVAEKTNIDALSLNSDVKVAQSYTNRYFPLTDLSTSSRSMQPPDSSRRSTGNVDMNLNGSIGGASSSKTEAAQDQELRMDLGATQGFRSPLRRPPLPDNMFENPKNSLSMVEASRSNSAKTDKAVGARKSASGAQEDGDDCQTKTMNRLSKIVDQNGQEMEESMIFDAGDSPSLFQGKGECEFDITKQHLTRPPRPVSDYGNEDATKRNNPFLCNTLPKVGGNTSLGQNPDSSLSPCSGYAARPARALTESENGLPDGQLDSDNEAEKAAGRQVDASRAANLTRSLVSALSYEQSPQKQTLSGGEASLHVRMDDPLISLIAAYRQEEEAFWPLLIGFTCDPRATKAISWVNPYMRKSFRRAMPPMLSFSHQLQRYCLKYTPGFDLNEAVKELDLMRERGSTGPISASKREPHTAAFKSTLPPGPARTGGEVTPLRGIGSRFRSLLDVDIPRSCGCDTKATQCAHAGSSTSGSLKSTIKSLTDSWDAEENSSPDGGDRGESLPNRPSTPTPSGEMSNDDKKQASRLPGFGLWKRRASRDKGKVVEILPQTEVPEFSRTSDRQSPQCETDAVSPGSKSWRRLRRGVKTITKPTVDGGSFLPRSPESLVEHQPSPTQSSALASTFRSNSTSTTGTPSTPRTHFSSPFEQGRSRPASPLPLTVTESLVFQNALTMATGAISSLHDFTAHLYFLYRASRPPPAWHFQQGYPSPSALPHPAPPYGKAGLAVQTRTPAQREALVKYQDSLRSCVNHIAAAVLVLEEQTRAIKAILDAAEPLDAKAEPGPPPKQSHKLGYFTRLLDLASEDGVGDRVSGTGGRGDELKMTGGLRMPGWLHLSRSGDTASEAKREGSVKIDSNKIPVIRQAKADDPSSTTQPEQNGAGLEIKPPENNQTQSSDSPKLSPVLLKWKFITSLRAGYVASVQLVKFPSLDSYTYPLLSSLGERLDRFEEKLWALENRSQNSVSSVSTVSGGESGSRSSGKRSLFKKFRAKNSVLTDPWTGAECPRHKSGRRTSPWNREEPSASSSGSLGSQGNSAPKSDSVRNFSRPSASARSQTQPSSDSLKSKNHDESTGKTEKWIAKTHESIREMRESMRAMMQTIIARRPGRIGIVDTEERLSLNWLCVDSQGRGEADGSTGQVTHGEASRLHTASTSSGRTGSGRSGKDEATLGVRHSPGCHYGHDASNQNTESTCTPGHGDAGVGLGIFNVGGDGSRIDVMEGGGKKKLPEKRSRPYSNRSITRESSTASIPLDVGSPAHLHCPGCGVDLGQSAPRLSPKDVPRAQGGPSQIEWVRKVMGPLGRKRTGQCSLYPESFGTQRLKCAHAKSEQQIRDEDEVLGVRSPRLQDDEEYVEQEHEWDADDDDSTSSSDQMRRQARRKSASSPLTESPYDRLTGRNERLALSMFGKAEPEWRSVESQVHHARNEEKYKRLLEAIRDGCHEHGHVHGTDRAWCLHQTGHDPNSSTDDEGGLEAGTSRQPEMAGHQKYGLARPKSHGILLVKPEPYDSGLGMTPSPDSGSSRLGAHDYGLAFKTTTGWRDSCEMSGRETDSRPSREHGSGMESEREPLLARLGRDRSKTM